MPFDIAEIRNVFSFGALEHAKLYMSFSQLTTFLLVARGLQKSMFFQVKTLTTGDADLRFYITTVRDG